ncbi:hypothetical protein OAN307_c30680 [Octadecabacter antarcticus 307]|uniref:Uncharacterized protein n=1 Tax=Octadecabacter antarcticus 307 TaxID=391626 RepID=M9R8R2_9RHOB|nr:hypothetical protein [Octadecabacter antarcticus]AGI68607.1 hypothetical protein OAN307_c30680 [Octadecabacter antarcticus 307]
MSQPFLWPIIAVRFTSANDNFTGGPYSAEIVREVRKALVTHWFITPKQKSSKQDGLAAIYTYEPTIVPSHLKFKCHGIGPMVEVRSERIKTYGNAVGGKRMSPRQFAPHFNPLVADMKAINSLALQYPLADLDGWELGQSKRIFNNGSLTSGGRMYGSWQNSNELERLQMTIGDEPVCEIDVTACFPNICHSMFGGTNHLGRDPYQQIKFVREVNDPDERQKMRKLAKLLSSVWVASRGNQTQFPAGKKNADNGVTVSIREQFDLSKNIKFKDLMGQVIEVFPFFGKIKADSPCLMFKESEIFSAAILSLVSWGIPAYPMHDALMVRLSDQTDGVEALQASLKQHLGFLPDVDVSYMDELGEVKSNYATRPHDDQGTIEKLRKPIATDWSLEDDFDVLEDY